MDIGNVERIDIEQEMRSAYLDYAMSVIVARALPDARDGLKPVQRRILYAMHELRLHPGSSYKKSARIVGEVLGKYHPHGDSAVYDAMARMSQDFSLRYPLVDGQGNFGSVDGDSPAAMRYTEARLAAISTELLTDIDKDTVDWAENFGSVDGDSPAAMRYTEARLAAISTELLTDIDKDTVDWAENFDGTLEEPEVLPARLPNLLLNGASGIAVGMATSIPPHNLNEVCDGLIYMIDHWDERDEISIETLLNLIPGPDFPTGGIILGNEGITHAYATGKGRVVVRAVTHVEEMSRGRHRIVVTELPYQTNKSSLLERIATLVREGRLTQISDLRDESDRRGMSIIIELKSSAQPLKVLNRLYKYTLLQSTFGVQILALVNSEPRLLTLKRALEIHVEHRREIIIRRSKYELAKAEARAHILEGLKIALDHLDAVITTIRESPDVDTARSQLIERFNLTEAQAQAILDMRLRRLAGLERLKIDEEYEELIRQIAYLEDLLASPRKILALIRNDLEELKETYGDPRRTRIVEGVDGSLDETDLVAEEEVIVSITQKGYIKRVPTRVYRTQGRGGRGVIGMATKEEDNVLYAFSASTLDSILFFTNQGKVYQERTYQIPDAGRTSQGVLIVSILPLEIDERVTAAVPVSDFEEDQFLTMVTVQGRTKRTPLSEFASVRPSGLIAISLEAGDELGWVQVTPGDAELILVTKQGQALRFQEEEIRPMGRSAMGVYGIRLREGDELTSAEVIVPGAELLVATRRGYGKRTPLEEFRAQGRYTMGVICVGGKPHIRGPVAAARVVKHGDEVTFLSKDGMALRARVDDIPQMGRSARGANLMDLKKGDRLASMAVLDDKPEAPEDSEAEESGAD